MRPASMIRRRGAAAQEGGHGVAAAKQLQQVVAQADQSPLASDLPQPSQQKRSEFTDVLDLAKHWLDDRLALGIGGSAFDRSQLASHALLDRGIFRDAPSRSRWQPIRMFQSASGYIGVNVMPSKIDDIVLTVVVTIGTHLLGRGTI